MEKFSLQHTVLYAKHWYKQYNPKGKNKTIWDDLVKVLEADGYLGTFEGDSFEQIKYSVCYLLIGQFERLPKKGHLYSMQNFYSETRPHNCWKYGYYTKGFTFIRSKAEIEASPDYDSDEAVVRFILSALSNLERGEWVQCKPDSKVLPLANGIKLSKIKEIFSNC